MMGVRVRVDFDSSRNILKAKKIGRENPNLIVRFFKFESPGSSPTEMSARQCLDCSSENWEFDWHTSTYSAEYETKFKRYPAPLIRDLAGAGGA